MSTLDHSGGPAGLAQLLRLRKQDLPPIVSLTHSQVHTLTHMCHSVFSVCPVLCSQLSHLYLPHMGSFSLARIGASGTLSPCPPKKISGPNSRLGSLSCVAQTQVGWLDVGVGSCLCVWWVSWLVPRQIRDLALCPLASESPVGWGMRGP